MSLSRVPCTSMTVTSKAANYSMTPADDIILVSAFDFVDFRWKDDGWNWAKDKAEALRAQIDGHQKDYAEQRRLALQAEAKGEVFEPEEELDPFDIYWIKTIENHSEFWDPPPPSHGKQAMVGYKMKGRFGERTRNDLARMMDEYIFHDLNWGSKTVTNHVFHDQIPNTVAGPVRGPWGYYITKVNRRRPPTNPIDVLNEKHYEMFEQDYLHYALSRYLATALDDADVSGLDFP